MNQAQQLQVRLGSVEEFSELIGMTGWDADFRQLSRGPSEVTATMMGGESSLILKLGTAGQVRQRALPPGGFVTMGLMTDSRASAKFGPVAVDWEALTHVEPGVGIDCVSNQYFGAYTLSFEERRLNRIAEALQLSELDQKPGRLGRHQKAPPASLARIRAFIEAIYANLGAGNASARQNTIDALDNELPEILLRAWHNGEVIPEPSRTNRTRALKRALDYINERPQSVISVEELCRGSACSISTLERIFREYAGVSPKQYLTAIRLSGVRQSLLDPREPRNIGQLATDWGFWHMSKFAADYRRMFRELPSDTRGISRDPQFRQGLDWSAA